MPSPNLTKSFSRPQGRQPSRDGRAFEYEDESIEDHEAHRGRFKGTPRVLLVIFAVLLAVSIAAGLSIFTGAISMAQQQAPVPSPRPAESSAPSPTTPQQQPRVTKTETFEDWIYRCVESAGSQTTRCSISQELSSAQSKATVFSWRIVQDGKGGLVGVWVTPPSVILYRGVVLDAGAPKPITVPFETCGPRACQAVATLAPDFVETLSKAEKATATFVLTNGKPVTLALSVKGLSAGIMALKR